MEKDKLIEQVARETEITKELKSRALLDDLFEFNKQVLKVEEGSSMVPLAPFHKELCEFTQVWEHQNRKLVLIPRGHLKSTLVTVGYTLQQIAKSPKTRVLIGNATYPMAVAFLSQIKDHLVKNSTFIDLYGDMSASAPKWTQDMVKIVSDEESYERKEPTITAYGMGGNLVSQHYDLIILDDIVNRESISTKDQIDKTILIYKDILDLLEPHGHLIMIGTRWHDSDLYGWILGGSERPFYEHIQRKAVEGTMDSGTILFPQKYNREYLKQLRAEKGIYEFSSQYLNECVPDEMATFKKEWIKSYDEYDIKGRPLNYFTLVDPAISLERTADFTVIITVGVDANNNIYVIEIFRDRVNPTQILNELFNTYDKYRPRQICIEAVAFQKSLQHFAFEEMRQRGLSLPISEVKPERMESKEMRIRGLVPYYEQGRIYHPKHEYNTQFLEDELTRFPKGQFDDIIDALSYFPRVIFPAKQKTIDEDARRRKYLY